MARVGGVWQRALIFFLLLVLFVRFVFISEPTTTTTTTISTEQPNQIHNTVFVEPTPSSASPDLEDSAPPPQQHSTTTSMTKFTYQLPNDDVSAIFLPSHCPNKFLHVNTHTYGRHHNQLQEFVNALAWSQHLGRTYVLGYFRHNHKWADPREFYDFSQWKKHYCFLYPDEFIAIVRRQRSAGVTFRGDCYGQEFQDTPIGKATKIKCKLRPEAPKHYSTRKGLSITSYHFPSIAASTADLLNLSGQFGFFIRPGLEKLAHAFGLLRPSTDVAEEINAFRAKHLPHDKKYLALHLRHREGVCHQEMRDVMSDLKLRDAEERSILMKQCTMPVEYVDRVVERYLDLPAPPKTVVFLASDHQNMTAEDLLVKRLHARRYKGRFPTKELGGLKGLAVDFFLLTEAEWFVMNQQSSISQNACYVRLGRGKACHGVVPSVLELFARNVTHFKPSVDGS
eukprot:PhM_4_TR16661/c0_g1_i1/m.37537